MQSSSEQPLVGEEHCVTTLITAAKETRERMNSRNSSVVHTITTNFFAFFSQPFSSRI